MDKGLSLVHASKSGFRDIFLTIAIDKITIRVETFLPHGRYTMILQRLAAKQVFALKSRSVPRKD